MPVYLLSREVVAISECVCVCVRVWVGVGVWVCVCVGGCVCGCVCECVCVSAEPLLKVFWICYNITPAAIGPEPALFARGNIQ